MVNIRKELKAKLDLFNETIDSEPTLEYQKVAALRSIAESLMILADKIGRKLP